MTMARRHVVHRRPSTWRGRTAAWASSETCGREVFEAPRLREALSNGQEEIV